MSSGHSSRRKFMYYKDPERCVRVSFRSSPKGVFMYLKRIGSRYLELIALYRTLADVYCKGKR